MFKLLIRSLFFTICILFSYPVFSDYSDATQKDMAQQCYRNAKELAKEFGRTLESTYTYYPAKRFDDKFKPSIVAFIRINIVDNYGEKNWATCKFNGNAQVVCFSDIFNLENEKHPETGEKMQASACWSQPRRF